MSKKVKITDFIHHSEERDDCYEFIGSNGHLMVIYLVPVVERFFVNVSFDYYGGSNLT